MLTLVVNNVYRAKKPRPAGSSPFNDRLIIWMNDFEVQYDGPAVKRGSRYPRVSREDFLKWAGEDVTEHVTCPECKDWPYDEFGYEGGKCKRCR